MPDYDAMKRELPRLKAALTRAKKLNPEKVVEAVEAAYTRFDVIGWPDCWTMWQRAGDDAVSQARREGRDLEVRDA